MSHVNEDLIRRIHDSFAAGRHPVAELFAPEVAWHVEGNNPLARTYRGRDEVFAAFRSFERAAEGMLQMRLVSVVANDGYALAVLEASGKREGRRYECRV